MKIARFVYQKKVYWGKIEQDGVRLIEDEPFSKIKLTKRRLKLSRIKLLAPAEPSKIILSGLNYRDHARELKMKVPQQPLIFLKPNTAVIGPGEKIKYPKQVKQLDYEAELAVVIRKKAKNIAPQQVSKYILGYTCLNDVTARDLQRKDGQWTRAKSFDTFCPIGPWIETELEPEAQGIELYLNGRLKQNSSTRNFIFSVNHLVSFISRVMTLLPQDIISTGTPPGAGPMKSGDLVEVCIKGIGCLSNPVV